MWYHISFWSSSNALGSPVFIHKFLKIVYILCPNSNLLHQSILSKASQMESFIQTNKHTQDFPFNFSGIHFYTCINLTEKNSHCLISFYSGDCGKPASSLHLGSAAIWVNFLHLCFHIVQCNASSLHQNRNGLFLYQTWRLAMDYTGIG